MSDSETQASKCAARMEWSTPEIRAIVPVERTRGGAFDVNDQDDFWYVS